MPSRTSTKASTKTSVVSKAASGPLDVAQIARASKALLGKLQSKDAAIDAKSDKTNLLADADIDDASESNPVWLILTTKKHITDKKRLKPGRISIPHPYTKNDSAQDIRVCLITADPQRKYKDLVAHPAFPTDISKLITRVIGLEKLKTKYNSYESKRQLLSEYDVFLADDRIISYLTKILGKIFYKTSAKRPIPVTIEGRRQNFDEQGNKRRKLSEGGTKVTKDEIKPADVAAEIDKALSSALVHLAPSTTTAVKVGVATMTAEQIQENIQAVVAGLVEKYVPQKWRNVRAIHIKGPSTIALPIWLVDELWTDAEVDIRTTPLPQYGVRRPKRKALTEDDGPDAIEVPGADGKMRKVERPGTKKTAEDDQQQKDEASARAARKESVKKQKAALQGNAVEPETNASAGETSVKPVKKRKKAADLN